jgi:hypothetical protein
MFSVTGITKEGKEFPLYRLVVKGDAIEREGPMLFESMQAAAAHIANHEQANAARLGIVHWQFTFE